MAVRQSYKKRDYEITYHQSQRYLSPCPYLFLDLYLCPYHADARGNLLDPFRESLDVDQ